MAKWDVARADKFHPSKSSYNRPSAAAYIRKATKYIGSDVYLVSTFDSYELLRDARVPMSESLYRNTSFKMNKLLEPIAELFHTQEDEILTAHMHAVSSNPGTPDDFIETLRESRKQLDSSSLKEINMSLDSNKLTNKVIQDVAKGKFDSILTEGIKKSVDKSNPAYTKHAVGYLQKSTQEDIRTVAINMTNLYNELTTVGGKNTYSAEKLGAGLKYIEEKVYPLVVQLHEVAKAYDLKDIPRIKTKIHKNEGKVNRNLIGAVYEANEYIAMKGVADDIIDALKVNEDDAFGIIYNKAEQYVVKAIGNLGGSTQQTFEKEGTSDMLLSLNGPNSQNFIRIDAKSASGGYANQSGSDYTFNYGKINIKDSFNEALKTLNEEALNAYYMVLGNILYYARLALNEDERQAAVNMFFANMSEGQLKEFVSGRFGGKGLLNAKGITANVPTLITISTRLVRFSELVRNMATMDLTFKSMPTTQYQRPSFAIDEKLLYKRKLAAFNRHPDPQAKTNVRNDMNHFGSQVANALFTQTNTVDIRLRIKI